MKIDVIQLRGRACNRECEYAVASMIARTREFGHDIHQPMDVWGSAQLARSRNQSLRHLRFDADFVLFLDDDMIPVEGALQRLIRHDLPMVSALCTTRRFPPKLNVARYEPEKGAFSPIDISDLANRVYQGNFAVGFGFVVIRRSLIAQAVEFVLSANDWLAFNKPMLDRMNVSAFKREQERARIEEIRRSRYEQDPSTVPVFQTILNDFQNEVSEDYHFSRLVHCLGVEPAVDGGCLVGHMGDFPFSPVHCGVQHAAEVRFDNN